MENCKNHLEVFGGCFSIREAVALSRARRTDADETRFHFILCEMSPCRTLLIVVVVALCVSQIGGGFVAPKPMNGNDNDLDSAVSENNHAKETERDSGKVGSGEGALAEVVAELRTEVRALKSELRGVQVGLSECAAARADARRTENDHVRVQWLQREMAETREVCCMLIMAH